MLFHLMFVLRWGHLGNFSCVHILLYEYESLFCNKRRYANHKFVAIIKYNSHHMR